MEAHQNGGSENISEEDGRRNEQRRFFQERMCQRNSCLPCPIFSFLYIYFISISSHLPSSQCKTEVQIHVRKPINIHITWRRGQNQGWWQMGQSGKVYSRRRTKWSLDTLPLFFLFPFFFFPTVTRLRVNASLGDEHFWEHKAPSIFRYSLKLSCDQKDPSSRKIHRVALILLTILHPTASPRHVLTKYHKIWFGSTLPVI